MEKGKFTNFENSYKINKNSYNNIFFAVVISRKRKFILVKKKIGGLVAFLPCLKKGKKSDLEKIVSMGRL